MRGGNPAEQATERIRVVLARDLGHPRPLLQPLILEASDMASVLGTGRGPHQAEQVFPTPASVSAPTAMIPEVDATASLQPAIKGCLFM